MIHTIILNFEYKLKFRGIFNHYILSNNDEILYARARVQLFPGRVS